MATIISKESLTSHNVGKYNFKIIASGNHNEENTHKTSMFAGTSEESTVQQKIEDVDSSSLSNSSKESLIESLMQKTDDMSSNFIKLQMKLESKEEEYLKSLEKAKEEAFSKGLEEGLIQASQNEDKSLSSSIELFSSSIEKLDKSSIEYTDSLEGIKSQLLNAAVDIAKEVIKVELSVSSNEVAKLLADELLQDLQGASKITLKVNPNNHGIVSENVGKLKNITVLSDSAISEGGVVVISDVGNIDAQISKRFDRVKSAALSE